MKKARKKDKMMKQSPVLVNPLFPELLQHLLETLRGLSPADWLKPTACAGWRVREVALHLLGDDVGMLSSRRDGYSIQTQIDSWESLVDFINLSNRNWIDGLQRISPRLIVDFLSLTGPQVCELFDQLDPYAIGGPVNWAGPEPAPVWLDLAREYTERWHHQQHIREAVGLPLLTQPRYLGPVLATFMFAFPYTYRDVKAEPGSTISLTIGGPAGNRWFIQRDEDAWLLHQGKPEVKPLAEITLDQDTAWRLFSNGLDRKIAKQRMIFEGDVTLAHKALEIVSILA